MPSFLKYDTLLSLSLFQNELELVLSRGVPSDDIIFSGVSKQLSQIKYAAKNGVDLLVCDNEVELCKISRCHPNAKYALMVFTTATLNLYLSLSLSTWEPVFLSSGCCYRLLQKQAAGTMTWQ